MRFWSQTVLASLSVASCIAIIPVGARAQTVATVGTDGSSDAQLRRLYEDDWAWREQQGLTRGARGSGAALPKVDPTTQQQRLAHWDEVLSRLDAIAPDALSAEERINAAVLREVAQAAASNIRFRTYERPFNADTFFWSGLNPLTGGFATAEDYRAYIARMRDIPRYFDEQGANMRAGLARGFTVPRIAATGREETMRGFLPADRTNAFWTAFDAMPGSIPAAEQQALRQEGEAAIRDSVAPAYAKLHAFMVDEYLPAATKAIGARELPGGPEFYQAQIRSFTTLDLTAEEIHAIGLAEVARIRAEMERVRAEAGFEGDLSAFMEFLRTDPQFEAKTPYELLAKSSYVVKRMDSRLGEFIGFLPRKRHGIVPVPPALAPIFTGGRGGIDNCMMNTYNLPARRLYTLPALTIHECTPGHSLQGAIAQEAQRRPAFRRAAGFSGYGEGWALYWEWLAGQIGIYETPYEEFGQLTYEMWRAARLVIDTGIHHYGWSREQAQSYLRDNAALADHEITTEIDRYIAWPGQALAYKLGEMLIRRKREEAQEALGPAFDERNFHDAILALGEVPLPVLEARLDQFIADGGQLPAGWNPALPEAG